MVRYCSFASLAVAASLLVIGCSKPSTPATNSTSSQKPADSQADTDKKSAGASDKKAAAFWEDYPDVPKVEIMTEVDGIKIPRMALGKDTLQLTGAIPADVGNEHAKQKPSEPTTGDTLTIRFPTEPKILNPITETSAVQTYIAQYVIEGLAWQNPETFAFEPHMAKKWVIEDSIKLAANYPGHERRLMLNDATPQQTVDVKYEVAPSADGKPAEGPTLTLKTTDRDGNPIGNTWVGFFAVGSATGGGKTGLHYWSDDKGLLQVKGIDPNQYVIKVGDEVYGESKLQEDGSLVVTPATEENPLREPLTLKVGEWIDLQQKIYTTLYLRENVKWSDGAPFTTKDLEFAYALLNSPFVDGDSLRTYYSDLVECKPFGAHTIRMKYRQQYFKSAEFSFQIAQAAPPWHFFEEIFRAQGRELTLEELTPEDETAKKQISAKGQEFGKFFNTDERYNSKPLGTGPYIVDKWERKDRVEIVRNPNYWNKEKAGHVDRIIFKFIPDQVTAFTAMKAGEIDFFYDVTPEQFFEDWASLEQATQETYVKSSWFSPRYSYIGWNELATPLKDRRVRLALSMLFDRKDFIERKLHGMAFPVSGPEYVFGPAYDPAVAPVAFDPNTARDLLSDAGWIDSDNDGILDRNGEKFQLTLRLPQGRATTVQIGEILQKNCKDVGIDLKIQTMEWASFVDKMRAKESDAVMLSWAMAPENDLFQIWHGSGAAREKRGSNHISFNNKQADQLIEMARVTLDETKRHRIQHSLHRLIDSEQPYSFMWTPKEFGAYHKRFRNVKWYRLRPGFDLSEWYVPKDEQLHK